jgi:hypothetical protein
MRTAVEAPGQIPQASGSFLLSPMCPNFTQPSSNPRLQRTLLRQGYGVQARAARSPLSRQPLGPSCFIVTRYP